MKNLPIEVVYGILAVAGGIARYLNSYVNGEKFKLRILIASAVVAGFSGFMFALLGETMNMPTSLLHIMAGVGGFFGEQSLKFIMEYITKKTPTPIP